MTVLSLISKGIIYHYPSNNATVVEFGGIRDNHG